MELQGAELADKGIDMAMAEVVCPYCKHTFMIDGGNKTETKIAHCESPDCGKDFAVKITMITHAHINTYRIGRKS